MDEGVGEDAVASACRGFCSVPGPLQSVQRAEFWGVILALQANNGVHLGVDNLSVVRHVGRLLDGKTASHPAELVKDGDLILLIERMLRLRVLDTVRISKVKGHADEALIRAGGASDLDRLGNNGPDEAADFGRRRVPSWIIDARRNFSGVCARWRPLVLGLHRFFLMPLLGLLSIRMVSLVLLWTLWFGLRVVPRRGAVLFMLFVIVPFFLGLLESGMGNGVIVAVSRITCHDVELWPYSVSILVKWVAFLYTVHWPAGWGGSWSWWCLLC